MGKPAKICADSANHYGRGLLIALDPDVHMVNLLHHRAQTTPPQPISEEGMLLSVPSSVHTLRGFRAWALSSAVPEKLPLTFVRGKVYIDMSKEEIRTHALVKTALAGALFQLNEELDLGHLFINGVLVTNVRAKVSNNPDIVVASYRSLKSARVRYIEQNDRIVEIEGAPDMVAEIVSNSSALKDTRDLRAAYHQSRIREYWLIDARGEDIAFQILAWRKTGYAALPSRAGWQRSRVFGRSFRLTRKQDRTGLWKYKLEPSDA